MNFFKPSFLEWGDILFIVIFIVVAIAFLREFRLTSKYSWVVLAGMVAFGGLFVFQAWRRKKMLEQFEKREKELRKLEEHYESLKRANAISAEAYERAKADLERTKVEAGLAILRADEELDERLKEIEAEYADLSVEESVAKIKEALR